MRFFKVIEIDENAMYESICYDYRFDVDCTRAEDGNVYVAIDEDAEDEFEICLDMFDKEE